MGNNSWMDDKLDPIEFQRQLVEKAKESKEEKDKELLESWSAEEIDPKASKELNKVNAYLKMEKLLKERDRLKQNNLALKEAKRKRDAGL